MNITRDVITDLLPAYLSGEASPDTQALVDEFLRGDPEFASIVQAARRGPSEPVLAGQRAMAPDQEREAVRRTRAVIRRQRWTLAFAIFLTLMPLSFTFGADGIRFFMLRDEPRSAVCWILASYLWFSYLRLQRRLRAAGL
jgi:predicted anti-sigma-YlaC factor YlaD